MTLYGQGIFGSQKREVDPLYANTVLILTGDSFLDRSFQKVLAIPTSQGPNIALDRQNFRFGQSSYRMSSSTVGAGQIVFTNPSNIMSPGVGDFCFEVWYFLNGALPSNFRFMTASSTPVRFLGSRTSGGRKIGVINEGVSWSSEVNWSPVTGAWTHIAVDRNGTTLRYFQNGTLFGSTTNSTNMIFTGQGVVRMDMGANSFWDELRLTKASRYTANFTPSRLALR